MERLVGEAAHRDGDGDRPRHGLERVPPAAEARRGRGRAAPPPGPRDRGRPGGSCARRPGRRGGDRRGGDEDDGAGEAAIIGERDVDPGCGARRRQRPRGARARRRSAPAPACRRAGSRRRCRAGGRRAAARFRAPWRTPPWRRSGGRRNRRARPGVAARALGGGERAPREAFAEALQRPRDAPRVAHVEAQADHARGGRRGRGQHRRAASIVSRIRRTAASSPRKIASPMRKWPMLSSATSGMAATGPTLS